MNRAELKHIISEDLSRFGGKEPGIKDRILRNEVWYIWRYIKHMRYVEYYQSKAGLMKVPFYWHMFKMKRLQFKLHFAIYPNTLEGGFRIYHVGGYVHVGPNVHIGRNCTMVSGVVFGNKTEEEDDRPVYVGDNCYFGIGAKILGPVRIGNNVTVGANAVVTKDVPDNTVVVGANKHINK